MARKSIDRTGHTYNHLTVLGLSHVTGNTRYWTCRCECGAEVVVQASNLASGGTKSCGCRRSRRMTEQNTRHGMAFSTEWESWRSMRLRCNDPTNASFHRYGARGIRVCPEWNASFERFYSDMGKKPTAHHTIDRIDNAKGYEPGNCRWASQSEQARNRKDRSRDEHGRFE